MDTLAEYEFKAIIIEHVSTPLYESLPYDMEIFVANDPIVRPIEETALAELKKRFHHCEGVDSLIQDVTLFLEGKLPKTKDNTFYHHHVWKKNAEENILKLVDSLVDTGKG